MMMSSDSLIFLETYLMENQNKLRFRERVLYLKYIIKIIQPIGGSISMDGLRNWLRLQNIISCQNKDC